MIPRCAFRWFPGGPSLHDDSQVGLQMIPRWAFATRWFPGGPSDDSQVGLHYTMIPRWAFRWFPGGPSLHDDSQVGLQMIPRWAFRWFPGGPSLHDDSQVGLQMIPRWAFTTRWFPGGPSLQPSLLLRLSRAFFAVCGNEQRSERQSRNTHTLCECPPSPLPPTPTNSLRHPTYPLPPQTSCAIRLSSSWTLRVIPAHAI